MRQFGGQHGSIFLLVVKLETLDKVLETTLLLVLFALAEDRQELVQLHFLLTFLLGTTQFFDRCICRVEVQGS